MHSCVYVILPPSTCDVQTELSRLLGGSTQTPHKPFPTFAVTCFCVGYHALRDSYTVVDTSERGRARTQALHVARQTDDADTETMLLRQRFVEVIARAQQHPAYAQPDPACDVCQGTGTRQTDRDPATYCDDYMIGGRWQGLFADRPLVPPHPAATLAGNAAVVSSVLTLPMPAAIITPEGYCYDGPLLMVEAADLILSEDDAHQRDAWVDEARSLLTQYRNHVVVVVDCHS